MIDVTQYEPSNVRQISPTVTPAKVSESDQHIVQQPAMKKKNTTIKHTRKRLDSMSTDVDQDAAAQNTKPAELTKALNHQDTTPAEAQFNISQANSNQAQASMAADLIHSAPR